MFAIKIKRNCASARVCIIIIQFDYSKCNLSVSVLYISFDVIKTWPNFIMCLYATEQFFRIIRHYSRVVMGYHDPSHLKILMPVSHMRINTYTNAFDCITHLSLYYRKCPSSRVTFVWYLSFGKSAKYRFP